MATRREFLTSGIPAGLAAGLVLSFPSAASATSLKFNRFVLDVRYPETHSAAEVMAARGIPVSTFAGDLTQVWYYDLDLPWRAAPQFVAGLTARDGLFVLERLAHDRQMRVLFRAYHEPSANDYIPHLAKGPGELVRGATRQLGEDWARSVWTGLMNSTPGGRVLDSRHSFTRNIAKSARSETLISWIMVPRPLGGLSDRTA